MVPLELEIMLQERGAIGPKSNCDYEGKTQKVCLLSRQRGLENFLKIRETDTVRISALVS